MRAPIGRTAWRFSLAVVSTALGLLLTVAFPDLLAPMRLFFLWAAVLVTAVVAGTGPAVVALALSLFGASTLFFEPVGSIRMAAVDVLRLALFALLAGGISIAVGMRRSAQERAAELSRELRRRELRYRTLVEAAPGPQAVWTATPDGRIEWSDRWMEITGLTREDVEAGRGMEVVHPDDAARTWERWKNALQRRTLRGRDPRPRR